MYTMSYSTAASAYADAVRALLAPAGVPSGERGARGPASARDLADQAERLAPLSAEVTASAAAQLQDPDAAERMSASTRLLAKALVDLDVAAHLLQAAVDDEDGLAWPRSKAAERGAVGLGATEEYLRLLLGEPAMVSRQAQRGEVVPTDLLTAQVELSNAVTDALTLISERAAKTGQTAFTGLLAMGVAEVAEAAAVVGLDLAQLLGQAEKVTRLYRTFRAFVTQAYDTLLAVLGKQVIKEATDWAVDWLDKLREGQLFGQLLEKLYQTQPTSQVLKEKVTAYQGDVPRFVAAINGVDQLNANYRQQAELAEKWLRGTKWLSSLALAAMPQAKLVLALGYIVLGAYIVLCGADYVDAPHFRLLNRVPGVRQVVEGNLGA
ncbi:MAG: hypothetical protein FJ026_07365 [Chloroflexi bacterium]|nr:hypothetical protein [Chloroflexota bacterium]